MNTESNHTVADIMVGNNQYIPYFTSAKLLGLKFEYWQTTPKKVLSGNSNSSKITDKQSAQILSGCMLRFGRMEHGKQAALRGGGNTDSMWADLAKTQKELDSVPKTVATPRTAL